MNNQNIRNVAIIAHVDHGKTTLVDAILKQTASIKQDTDALVMDSMDLERERGITIRAKNASIQYKDFKINIIDTPGHADFGGEVERTLKMADGVILLVDAKEGPMPQTKFVLKKALALGLSAIVLINKVDKTGADPDHTINKTFDLFVSLHASEKQLDFPILYASGRNGIANDDLKTVINSINDPENNQDNINIFPLLDKIIHFIPAPQGDVSAPLSIQILSLAYDKFIGRLGIGKILSGKIEKNQQVMLAKPEGNTKGKASSLQQYQGMSTIDVMDASAGDIVAVAGFDNVSIGDTITTAENPQIQPAISIEPPTVKMTFSVNTSPFSGKEGTLVTSRQIRERLDRELETNVALKVEPGESGEKFLVSGRGELHLGILIETMRREGFELEVSQPEVIFIEKDGEKLEPYEAISIDVPSEFQGAMITEMGRRGGELLTMDSNASGEIHAEYVAPTRGLIGFKSAMITQTKGTAVVASTFEKYDKICQANIKSNEHGSLMASEGGTSSGYGLNNAQERGVLFIGSGVDVYEGMIVGQNALDSDIEVNVCKGKKLTNMRSSGNDDAIILTPPRVMSLDLALEYIGSDELVEITPQNIRIRKKLLTLNERKRAGK